MSRESNRSGAERPTPARPAAGARVPHSSFTEWEPPTELDDDKPIFSDDAARPGPPAARAQRSHGESHRGGRNAPSPPPVRGAREHEDDIVGYTVEDAPASPAGATPAGASSGTGTSASSSTASTESSAERDALLRDFAELFINVGRREGARPEDFQRIFDTVEIPAADVGRVRIRDRMSFVSVKKDTAERAIAALVGQVIGGRTIVAEIAKERGSSRGSSGAY